MYRWIDHTAEVQLAISAPSEREVFADAAAALAELLGFADAQPRAERELSAAAPDRPALLAAWLEELVYLAESEGFVAVAVEGIDLADDALQARVAGVIGAPSPLIKAVTYHQLEFARSGDGYVANVVLDV